MKMKQTIVMAVMLMALMACKNSQTQVAEIIDLPRAETPDSVVQAMEGFFQKAATDSFDIHSVMIVKDGQVIFSRWQSEGVDTVPHVLHSVSKTFTATAVGLAIADGKMALTDKIIDFFPDKLPVEVSDNLKAMTVRDLLTMTCGHDEEPATRREGGNVDWVEAFLAHPVVHEPGTFYLYNSLGTYMLSAIVQKVTGEKVVDYLNTRLFEPLHIDKPRWEESPQGIKRPATGCRATAIRCGVVVPVASVLMEPEDSTSSSFPTRMPSSPSPPMWQISRASSILSGTTSCLRCN